LDVWGEVPTPPTIELRAGDIERALGVEIPFDESSVILRALGFRVEARASSLFVTPPSSRLDVRDGVGGRADVIEEIARLYSYLRLPRHTPTWPEPGGLNNRQRLRRLIQDVAIDVGANIAWTPTLGSDADFDLLADNGPRVRITNPLAADESVLRASMLVGLVKAWGKNIERGTGNVVLGEIGTVFAHPETTTQARATKGGEGGHVTLSLPRENERFTIVLGRGGDDATSAMALWATVFERLGLADVVVRTSDDVPRGFHPTRSAALVDRASSACLGWVGEVDPQLVATLVPSVINRRVGLVDFDFDSLADASLATRRSDVVVMPSRYPSAVVDLALVTPMSVHAQDLAHALRGASELVEEVVLFDVYDGANLAPDTRSLAYSVRFSSPDRTLSDEEVSGAREALIDTAAQLGAALR
jgi:phenylalanyl-tRNA synthetase beta chain